MKTATPSPAVLQSGPPGAPAPAESSLAPSEETQAVVASAADFPELESIRAATATGSLNHLLDVAVCVTAELGRVTMSIGEILKLGVGSVVELDRSVSEPVDLLVQGVPFARGEVVVVKDRFAIRIQEILDPKQGGKK
jgi:flagellar motor switch protein FliN/FliY